jgi:hypothetical protein
VSEPKIMSDVEVLFDSICSFVSDEYKDHHYLSVRIDRCEVLVEVRDHTLALMLGLAPKDSLKAVTITSEYVICMYTLFSGGIQVNFKDFDECKAVLRVLAPKDGMLPKRPEAFSKAREFSKVYFYPNEGA